jgi:hypothetical protein
MKGESGDMEKELSMNEQIRNDYVDYYKKYIQENPDEKDTYLDKERSCSKIDGSLFAHIMMKYIKEVLPKGYTISVNNSYFKGSFVEWDLLIVKDNDKYKNKESDSSIYNIYDPDEDDVKCVIEFKCGGNSWIKTGKIKTEMVKNIKKLSKFPEINYLYIVLCESETRYNEFKKAEQKINNNEKINNKFKFFCVANSWRWEKTETTKDDLKEIIESIIE